MIEYQKFLWRIGTWVFNHMTTLTILFGVFWLIVRPSAEEFVRDTVSREKFASERELSQQTLALRDLAARFAQQSEIIADQSQKQTALQTDIEAIKDLQRETLRVLLRGERN